MPKTRRIYNSFNAGEVSPAIEARSDLEKYASACNTLENLCILPQGGVSRRPGTQYAGAQMDMTRRARLIPFVYSSEDAYVLEVGHQYIRPIKNRLPLYLSPTNLVSDGDFASGISGWLNYSGKSIPTVTYDENTPNGYSLVFWDSVEKAMTINKYVPYIPPITPSSLTYVGRATYIVTTEVGVSYKLFVNVIRGSVAYKLGSIEHGVQYGSGTTTGSTEITFTATSVQTFVELEANAYNNLVKQVSVSEVSSSVHVDTPYQEGDLQDLRTAQSGDIIFFTHKNYPVYRLMRYSDYSWAFEKVYFSSPPTAEAPVVYTTTVTLSQRSVGSGITATAAGSIWSTGDIGKKIYYRGGVANITQVVSGTEAIVEVLSEFPVSSLPSGWSLSPTPMRYLKLSSAGVIGEIVTMTLCSDAAGATPIAGFADIVGKYIRYSTGYAKIKTIQSTSVITAEIISPFPSSVTPIPPIVPGAWSIETEEWNDTDGYPSVVCFHEQRMFLASTRRKPTTIWGSVVGSYYDFRLGTAADDAVKYQVASGSADVVRWLVPARVLVVGTGSEEFRVSGGSESPITPTNIDVKIQTSHGSSNVPPVRIGDNILFVQRSGTKVRDFSYTIQSDGYESADITILADHITLTGIVGMSYSQEPISRLWLVRSDGVLLSATYVKSQQVTGWSRHITSGYVESVATIPAYGKEDTYVIVRRTVNGSQVRYIEVLDPDILTDSSLIRATISTHSTVPGLSHLEGEDVDIVSDGILSTGTVSGGSITLSSPALRTVVGIRFIPKIVTVRPESSQGTAQGLFKRWAECWVRVLNTMGLSINGNLQEDDSLVSTDIRVNDLGYDRDGRVEIEQNGSYPCTILSVFGTLVVGD